MQEAYPEVAVVAPSNLRGQQTKYYETKFADDPGIGFGKRRVAEKVKSLLLAGKGDAESLESLKCLFDAILAALKKQGGERTSQETG